MNANDGIIPLLVQTSTLVTNWTDRITRSLLGTLHPATGKDTATNMAMRNLPRDFDGCIAAACARYDLPEDLIRAVIKVESNFNPRAVSRAGAKGLMQLMDGTARSLGVLDSFDPAQNIEGGATYLRRMLDRYDSLALALAAYNAGPGAVDRYGGVPPFAETQAYVQRVLGLMGRDREGPQQEWEG